MYIQAASSITKLDTFSQSGFSQRLSEILSADGTLVQPDYKQFIPAALLRRTPKINRMAIACMEDCLSQCEATPESIIVGTGLGCLHDTQRFLNQLAVAQPDQMLSPTAFIQSGHNAISGQLALYKKNPGYNMTHVQQGLSFEYALKDALLCMEENHRQVLVGGVDEKIEVLDALATRFGWPPDQVSEGCSFFVLDHEPAAVRVLGVDIVETSAFQDSLEILQSHGISLAEVGQLYVGQQRPDLNPLALSVPYTDYSSFCGKYFTNAAFGFHLAYDYLMAQPNSCYALVINQADHEHSGLILLRRD